MRKTLFPFLVVALVSGAPASAAVSFAYAYTEFALNSVDLTVIDGNGAFDMAKGINSAFNNPYSNSDYSPNLGDATAGLDPLQAYIDQNGVTTSPQAENSFNKISFSTTSDYSRADSDADAGSLNIFGTSSGVIDMLAEANAMYPGTNDARSTFIIWFGVRIDTGGGGLSLDFSLDPYVDLRLGSDVGTGALASALLEVKVLLGTSASPPNDHNVLDETVLRYFAEVSDANDHLTFDPEYVPGGDNYSEELNCQITSFGYCDKQWFHSLDEGVYFGRIELSQRARVMLPGQIPEPGTLALFSLGLAGIGAIRRKKLAA